MVEDVLQEHARAFLRRQRKHEMFDGSTDSRPTRFNRLDDIRHGCFRLGALPDVAPAEEVDALIVRNAKQPRRAGTGVVERVQPPIGVEQRVLHDVLAVEYGTGHARAVFMKLWSQIPHRLQKREIARLKEARIGWPRSGNIADGVRHIMIYAAGRSGDTESFRLRGPVTVADRHWDHPRVLAVFPEE